jgi:hypothetical protein
VKKKIRLSRHQLETTTNQSEGIYISGVEIPGQFDKKLIRQREGDDRPLHRRLDRVERLKVQIVTRDAQAYSLGAIKRRAICLGAEGLSASVCRWN